MDKIPFYSLEPQHQEIGKEMLEQVSAAAASNWYVLGARLSEFEKRYAAFSGCRFTAGVANGLDALFLSLRALNIGVGDEVIVPAHTFIATWLAVTMTGAKPVPVDVDPITCNIDPARIEDSITPKTRAVMPVHLYGRACDMTTIMDIARKRKLFVVEDNAQAHGAMHNGRMTGTFGDINATSFYPTKNLGALGDGGAITTSDPDLYDKVRQLRNYGSGKKYYNDVLGINSRLDEMQAAVLTLKLRSIEQWNRSRVDSAAAYLAGLKNVGDIALPPGTAAGGHVYHLFVIRTAERDNLKKFLEDKGIETVIHYPVPPHLQKAYKYLGFDNGSFPIAEAIADTCLSLPLWPGVSRAVVDQVALTIRQFYAR